MSESELIKIEIQTDPDCLGIIPDPRGINGFMALAYKNGGFTWIPDNMFSNWRNYCNTPGKFSIGRCSGLGVGSSIRYSNPYQSVKIGRYVSAGIETIFMCSGYHEIRGISTCEFSSYDDVMDNPLQREYDEIIIKNDVWLGDEVMIMADSVIENGCVIGARSLLPLHFRSEPFGIYIGSPAKLKRFRFSEKVRELLLDIAWWDMPFSWIKENNQYFLHDLTMDDIKAIDILQELKEKKEQWMTAQNISAN